MLPLISMYSFTQFYGLLSREGLSKGFHKYVLLANHKHQLGLRVFSKSSTRAFTALEMVNGQCVFCDCQSNRCYIEL